MKNLNLIALFLFLGQCLTNAQDLPLVYENDFASSETSGFIFTDANAWRITDGALELYGKSDYKPPFRSPFNIAIIDDLIVGDFTMKVDLKQTGKEYGHRDMCLFFGINDPTNFYYVHIASVADDHAHNIFLVNDEARRKIGTFTTEGVTWGNSWNKVKIERVVENGSIKIYFNDMNKPIMETTDLHFPAGSIGFGSFDDTGMIDNIKIYGEKTTLQKSFK
ncbi:hypothetical protein [Portibacter lacus]|uniref:DUF1080 domain-containing protein n=1 Tax=Portibacter lacus TaxID=1099794 RepID=A0AA37SP14_9BACT|nr:hypothetical protein [Portibacter lacus]GLR17350.1 hypothetical protein GCM10007940_19650 [Portibacter lacus]